ncbi:hypothetical protein [Streptomyces sp. NPDC048057]|uniref:hypothetical protein n=1 Tax=Streptomyces sp. NPDC048057 TaxID=3155628 RepID=UPI0033C94654
MTTTIPRPTGPERSHGGFAVVGDRLLISRDVEKSPGPGGEKYVPGGGLYAIPIGGSQQHQLLRYSDTNLATAPDGSVLVVGGSRAGTGPYAASPSARTASRSSPRCATCPSSRPSSRGWRWAAAC